MNNILICGNDAVYKGILLEALSYIKHNDKPVKLYILTMDLSEIKPNYIKITDEHVKLILDVLQSKNKESNIDVIDCKEMYLNELANSKNNLSIYTPYAILRLFADRVINEDKILYLDTDIMVNKSLDELFNIDLGDYEYAGARDYLGRVFINPRYINSGVLLLNLKRIRETKLFQKCLDELKIKKYAFPDQTVLNKFVLKKKFLPMIYNYQHGYKKKCVLKHFCKTILWRPFYIVNIKQWEIDRVHKVYHIHAFDDIYEQYNEILKGRL